MVHPEAGKARCHWQLGKRGSDEFSRQCKITLYCVELTVHSPHRRCFCSPPPVGSGQDEVKDTNKFDINSAGQIEACHSKFIGGACLKDIGSPDASHHELAQHTSTVVSSARVNNSFGITVSIVNFLVSKLLVGLEPKTPPKKRVMKMEAAFLLVAVPVEKRPRQ
jgi:hypothetical protein